MFIKNINKSGRWRLHYPRSPEKTGGILTRAHRGARAGGFAACVAECDTAGLTGKVVLGIKNFPGCGAVLLPGCTILFFLEERMKRYVSFVTLYRLELNPLRFFSYLLYEEKFAIQRSLLLFAIPVSPAKAVPEFHLIKNKLFFI